MASKQADESDVSAGLRLIVKNSSIEVIEVDSTSNMPRVRSLNIFDRRHQEQVLEEDFNLNSIAMAKSKAETLHTAPPLAEADCAASKRARCQTDLEAKTTPEEGEPPAPSCAPRKRME